MVRVRQSAEIHWGFGVPKLKGRLVKPIIYLPVKKAVKDPISADTPVYIKPIELKPFVPDTIEPPLQAPIIDIIPPFIGDLNEQSPEIHKGDDKSSPTVESSEAFERPTSAGHAL